MALNHSDLFVGLMSGTSLDGIDAVLTDFSDTPRLLASYHLPFHSDLRAQLLGLNTPQYDDLRMASECSVALAKLYAQAVKALLREANTQQENICAIGCHGQTIRHRPEAGYSLQINQPALLAELCNIDVVADFRSRDIAAGGQGAPLVPAFHAQILRSTHEHRVILNLGGIANVTNLPPSGAVGGFDTGPANALMDAWIFKHQGKFFDSNGSWAATGNVIPDLVNHWLAHPFFALSPPKSCGREEFSLAWVEQTLQGHEAPEDVQASLSALTAISAARAVTKWCGRASRVLLCGGGAHNELLCAQLQQQLAQATIQKTDALGIPGDWLEAFAFAWLARCAIRGQSGNLPAVTGAKGARILGAIYPAWHKDT